MKIRDVFALSTGNLRRNRMRSVLTITGVTIGIAAIVFLVSLGFGLQNLSIKKITSLDALTTITVSPGNNAQTKLNEETVNKFKGIKGVSNVSTTFSVPSQISYNNKTTDSVTYGLNPEYIDIEGLKIKEGKSFSSNDAKEVIVSQSILKVFDVKDYKSVLGQDLEVNFIVLDDEGNIKKIDESLSKQKLKIVGFVEEEKNNVYISIDHLKPLGLKLYNRTKVKVNDKADLESIRSQIDALGFTTISVKDTINQIDKVFLIVKIILGAFGMIALLVASIGIFNTMTIALLERTHEIGVMKAIGATDKDIKWTFISEVSVIGLLGGILGVISGIIGGYIINWLVNSLAKALGGESNTLFYTPIEFILIAIGFSFFVSTLAGFYPAKRASKLSPIEALRYE